MEPSYNGEKIGKKLISIRKKMGLKQVDVAKRLGISKSLLCKYERGIRRVSDENKVMLSRLYKVPIESIFFDN